MLRRLCVLLIPLVIICSCRKSDRQETKAKGVTPMSITVTSPAFKEGESIPAKYTCDGQQISPPLNWTSVPSDTKSIALIADDPDAPRGTFTHWVLFNLPPGTTSLPENMPKTATLKDGAEQGMNSGGTIGYTPPCPPSGTHRYYFKVYALDTTLSLRSGIRAADLTAAMDGHILAQGQLMGRYSRQ